MASPTQYCSGWAISALQSSQLHYNWSRLRLASAWLSASCLSFSVSNSVSRAPSVGTTQYCENWLLLWALPTRRGASHTFLLYLRLGITSLRFPRFLRLGDATAQYKACNMQWSGTCARVNRATTCTKSWAKASSGGGQHLALAQRLREGYTNSALG